MVERDGEGLTELEYVLTMALELGIVQWEQVPTESSHFWGGVGERVPDTRPISPCIDSHVAHRHVRADRPIH